MTGAELIDATVRFALVVVPFTATLAVVVNGTTTSANRTVALVVVPFTATLAV